MYEFFFQIPWWVPAGLTVAGIATWLWANNRLRHREKRIGLGLVLLAMGLSLLSYLVDTPAEVVERLTRQFVTAVVERDVTRTAALLDTEAIAFNWNRQDIISGAKYYAEKTSLKSARITGLQVEKEGQDLVSYLGVWSDHTGGSELPMTNLTSQWKMIWTGKGKQWLLVEIIPLQIANVQREQIERQYLDHPVLPR